MSIEHVLRVNKPLFDLPESHPAKRFLCAFVACLDECVGREIPYRGKEDLAADEDWFSLHDGRVWSFSSFAYIYLAFTVELDGWLTGAATATRDEIGTMTRLPYLRTLMRECKDACVADRNEAVLAMVEQVENLIDLWEACIKERWQVIGFRNNRLEG
jgi:hypothetical protein